MHNSLRKSKQPKIASCLRFLFFLHKVIHPKQISFLISENANCAEAEDNQDVDKSNPNVNFYGLELIKLIKKF